MQAKKECLSLLNKQTPINIKIMTDNKRTFPIIIKTSAYLLVLLGIVHIALTPLFFNRFGLDVLWFGGTGMGLVFLGNLNLLVLLSKKAGFYMMAITSNIMGLLLMVLILFMNPAPQAWIGVLLLLVLLVGSISEHIQVMRQTLKAEKLKKEDDQKQDME